MPEEVMELEQKELEPKENMTGAKSIKDSIEAIEDLTSEMGVTSKPEANQNCYAHENQDSGYADAEIASRAL